jgi:beta-lactamase superfamily II metal-dependent hydrolase
MQAFYVCRVFPLIILNLEQAMAITFKYAATNEAPIFETTDGIKGSKTINKILLGTYVKILEEKGNFCKVQTAGPDGWIKKSDLSDNMGIKIFYLDVGQGDGVLMEVGGLKILIDAGPGVNMHSYLTKWQYTYLLAANEKIHIDYLFISHFDIDHYRGFIKILEDPRFTFGTIYHAGILKFAAAGNPYNTGLGNTVEKNGVEYLTKIFDNLLSVNESAAFNRDVTNFIEALMAVKLRNGITKTKRLAAGDVAIKKIIEGQTFKIEVLAPFVEKVNNKNAFVYWTDDGVTVNGHSLVLKVTFGIKTFLLGGDLNTKSENYLMQKYAPNNPFEVDVAKSCHHGSSDFTEKFMALINPFATVISSGDNESFSHPRADAIGCAGRYARGARPLVYSTELARSIDLRSKKILFGMINCRSNGSKIYMAQMKENNSSADVWDAYDVG